ncbi:MAG: dihydrofolate reductase family protein [Gammaproteobacteria bacterium]
MSDEILQLYPTTGNRYPLEGLYLNEDLQTTKNLTENLAENLTETFIYSNFVSSIDGRIALPVAGKSSHQVPAATGNARDWRLFQELAAQADLLISTARFFRQASAHEAQDNLPVGQGFPDLRQWRLAQGLKTQPDIAIFSASLDIPVQALEPYQHRKLYIFTGAGSDPKKRSQLARESHADIILCGNGRGVDGNRLRATFNKLGYYAVYAVAGPRVFHTLVSANALDRLYLTTAQRLLGGQQFDTINWGEQLLPAIDMPLLSLYYDPTTPDNAGQTFAAYGK